MAGSPYVISATLSPAGPLANYNVTYNTASFMIAKANASVTANAASKTYGTADPALTGTLAGFLAADGVTASYSRTAGETVAGGPYTIGATLSPAAALDNYNVTYNTASFSITEASASVSPNAASKTYGAADPALTGTLSGFLAADGVTAAYSRTAGQTVGGSPYTISGTLSPAGALANYNITYNTASFTIAKANASVTANAASKTYGAADPAVTGTLSGFLAADGVTASYSRTAGESVGGSPYTIGATLSPATALDNYNVTYNTASFTIDKANATVTPNAASKVYGSADPTLTGTLSGFLAADGVTASYSRTAGETVGGGPTRLLRRWPGRRARQLQRHLRDGQLHDCQGQRLRHRERRQQDLWHGGSGAHRHALGLPRCRRRHRQLRPYRGRVRRREPLHDCCDIEPGDRARQLQRHLQRRQLHDRGKANASVTDERRQQDLWRGGPGVHRQRDGLPRRGRGDRGL